MAATLLRRLLAHPLTASLDMDDPATTELRKQIIAGKPFLKAIYDEWYTILANALPAGKGEAVELGSGAGYCARFIPGLITSDVFLCSSARVVLDAQRLPFSTGSLRAVTMTNVLHHMPDVRRFLIEAVRCLRSGGKILMIEPWVTPWSRFVYRRLHGEPFAPDAEAWSFAGSGPLSGANVALPWIVFARDRQKLQKEFPELIVEQIRPFLPFRYLVSGGVSLRSLAPRSTQGLWAGLERMLEPSMARLGMFAFVSVRRR
ncbi:MAG TPA: methyltransferase domain-containing protein [Candidatus Dormibacteraeota bacterium]|nr:methyltransferase domain-containing protein [Candidatus Dormibacteraeota bacterium]